MKKQGLTLDYSPRNRMGGKEKNTMKIKSFRKSIIAAIAVLLINTNPLSAMSEEGEIADRGRGSGVAVTLGHTEEEQRKSPVTSKCFLETVCDKFCQTMVNYIPSLPTFMAKQFMSQYPVFSEKEQDTSLKLFQLLTRGKPVDTQVLAESVSLPHPIVSEMLGRWPDVYYDEDQRIIGHGGLTFEPTQHKIMFEDRTLYTWCAWDTLFLPAILGKTLEIESQCPVDDSIVRVRVDQEGVKAIEPKEAVISFMLPSKECIQKDIQSNFCHYVNFFPSTKIGNEWVEKHSKTYLISIEEAFKIGQIKNQAQFGKKLQNKSN
jgi:alkylmercury lyase